MSGLNGGDSTDVDGQLQADVEHAPASPPWQLIDLQDCLHDSPQFRRMLSMKEEELAGLERKLEKVVTTCATMVESGQIYRENCRLFSLSLKELSEHFTELATIKDAYLKFCEMFNEIQTYYRVLFDQAQRTVMKGLKEFLTGELKKVHTSKKSFHKTSAELNYVVHKNANASRQKPTEADEISSLLQTMQVEFTHQALDYCYQINVVSCLKGYQVTEKLISFLAATSTFFHQGFDRLKLLDPFLRDVVKELDDLQTQSNTDINYMRDRHSLVSTQHMRDDTFETPLDNVSMPIVFRGHLFKRSHNAFKSWNRRYFELRDGKLVYLKKDSENDYAVIADDLRLCTVKLADDLERRFCFEVVTPSRSCMLQADSDVDRRKWCTYLEAGIARALRITSSNKSRETRRSRLTSSVTVTPTSTEFQNRGCDSPCNRSGSPTSLNSNLSCTFDFLDIPGNDLCADCSRPNPKWASLNLGIVLCIDCSGIHRSLGVHISKVRSITLDDWDSEHQRIMCLLGNDRVNSIFEFQVPSHVRKPSPSTSASDREEYIRLKYVNRAFVHPHPDFNRPEVPIPPPRIQGTLMRAAATSPKLAGRLNRPVSMATGLEVQPSPTTSPLPPTNSPANFSGESTPFGGLGLRPESMALLEENWKKLEKNGRLQQWNLKSMYSNVVKAPRFSFHKFPRPGSFRKKKSPLSADDYSHSDNELEDSLSSLRTSYTQPPPHPPNSPSPSHPPQKPPRSYTTTWAQIESPSNDDFSSDLMNTFERLGSVYSISGLLKEEGEETDDNSNTLKANAHRKITRSVSATVQIDPILISKSSQMRKDISVPKIKVASQSFDADDLIAEEDDKIAEHSEEERRSSLNREISRSMGSLPAVDEDVLSNTATPTHKIIVTDVNQVETTYNHNADEPGEDAPFEDDTEMDINDIKDRTLKHFDYSEYIPDDDDSSVDSYMSAEDRNEFLSRQHSSSPHEMIKRPDSEASELFHTPPNSLSPSPTGLESISPSHITNIGRVLGVSITLEDSQATSKRQGTIKPTDDISDLAAIGNELHANDEDAENGNEDNVLKHERKDVKDSQKSTKGNLTLSIPGSSTKESSDDDAGISAESQVDQQLNTEYQLAQVNTDAVTAPQIPVSSDHSPNRNPSTKNPVDEVDIGAADARKNLNDAGNFHEIDRTQSNFDFQSDSLSQYSEYDIHIIPENISPSKFIFECSLNGDLGGILSGIAHGGVVNKPNEEEGNKYPVHQACITGNDTVLEYLYQNGAKLNIADDRGCTPIHLASMNGYANLVVVLLKRGASVLCIDKDGKDPLAYAMNRGNGDIVRMLKSAKGDAVIEIENSIEDVKQTVEESVEITFKNSPETDSLGRVKSRSMSSSTNSSSDRVTTSGSELSVSSSSNNSKASGLLSSKSKLDT